MTVTHNLRDLIAHTGGIDTTPVRGTDVDIGATSIDNGGAKIQAGNDLKASLSGVANLFPEQKVVAAASERR